MMKRGREGDGDGDGGEGREGESARERRVVPTRRLYVLQKHAAGQVSSKRKSDRHDAANKKTKRNKKKRLLRLLCHRQ